MSNTQTFANLDMNLYNQAASMIAYGQKQTAPKNRRCLKCSNIFHSKGDRICDVCSAKNKKFGKIVDDMGGL